LDILISNFSGKIDKISTQICTEIRYFISLCRQVGINRKLPQLTATDCIFNIVSQIETPQTYFCGPCY